MSMLSKFRRFEAGNSHDRISDLEFKLFKSELTSKQWDLIDKIERRNAILFIIAIICYFSLGIVCGAMLGISHAIQYLIPVV